MTISIRAERPGDAAAIRAVTADAFAGVPYSDGSESGIIDALRAAGDLSLSLVAETDGTVAGHVAFSPVVIEGGEDGWFGLGPVSVRPDLQRLGIGSRLIGTGIAELRLRAARGVVLVGDPAYYARFGFERDIRLVYPRPGGEFLQRLVLAGSGTGGVVRYARAFG
ncbi:N-acetyltransferase [Tsuneonella sp. YG55]|uniref:N-acetyltransferase n=1 Tax=Tsuneonella litorea TaxID=2976475 RepID=A0A9X3A6U0_9SPHN|nr:N-acetyltransferase [Tsuneonella litorea]MCT2557686.1 N-acetyltransferase [Tsuneonella litorea]